MIRIRYILVPMAAFLCYATGADAAGGRVHAEMGRQAWFHYLSKNGEMLPGLSSFLSDDSLWHAYYSGCLFPDWGYPGGINRDTGEDCHWREFLDCYFDVLCAKYPPPWDYETKRRIAFFFGVVTHDMTDLPWHFDEGTNVAFENRGEREDAGHDANLDMICHLFVQAEYGILPGLQGTIWFPMDDILEAFAKRGKAVTAAQIEAGRTLLEAASLGTVGFGSLSYWHFKMKYPWSHRHYEDYYYGGVQHGAALSAVCIRYWYARLHGWSCLQNMPAYSCQPPGYIAHAPCRDTTIGNMLPGHNAGGEPVLEVARDVAGAERRALLHFTLENISKDVPLADARLWLHVNDCTEQVVVAAHAVNRAWNAGNGVTDNVNGIEGRPAMKDEATWEAPWQSPGCDHADADRDGVPTDSAMISPPKQGGHWVSWDLTPIATRWLAHPETNHGVLLQIEGAGKAAFLSSESFKSRSDEFCGGVRIVARPMLILRTL